MYEPLHIFLLQPQLPGSLHPIELQNPELASSDILLYRIAHKFNRSSALAFRNGPRLIEKRLRKADRLAFLHWHLLVLF
jgi:hypothetical protein